MTTSTNKKILSGLIVLAVAALLCACSDSSGRAHIPTGPNQSMSEEQIERNTIVRDVLGGALTTSIDPVAFSFDNVTKRAITVNVEFSAKTSTIDEYYTFKGADGADSLTIGASGNVEEIDTPDTDASVLKFAPLNLLIHFENFIFANACGIQSILTGDMECRVKGDYTRTDEHFKGTATCTSGTFIKPMDMSYVFADQEHIIHFSVNVTADGNAFNLDSYTFTGSFFLDNRIVAISNFAEALSCTVNSDD